MNKLTLMLLAILISVSAVFAAAIPADTTKTRSTKIPKTKVQYTCTMHPEVLLDKPGKCPKCGMTLVKKEPGKKKPATMKM